MRSPSGGPVMGPEEIIVGVGGLHHPGYPVEISGQVHLFGIGQCGGLGVKFRIDHDVSIGIQCVMSSLDAPNGS